MNAAQHGKFACVSPLAVFEEMEELVKNVTVYEFLKQEPLPGGYHENKKFIYIVREKFLDLVDDEVRSSMGLVEERQYADLFGKYVTHVSHWTKKEKLRNPLTGRLDDPDEDMMTEVEKTLGLGQKRDDFRHEVISRIARVVDRASGAEGRLRGGVSAPAAAAARVVLRPAQEDR